MPSLTTLLLCASLAAGTALPPLGYERKLLKEALAKRQDGGASCHGGDTPVTTAPKTNVWSPISAEDNLAVWNLLHAEETGLNLTIPDDATLTDNYVFWIDTLHTNKSDVLPYIDGDGPLPPKYARAIIFEGGKANPGSQEYMIGPLPVSGTTTIQPLDYIYNGGMGGFVPYNARYADAPKSNAIAPLITEAMTNISDITMALFEGGAYFGPEDDRTDLTSTSGTPLSFDGTQGFRNIMFRKPGDASYLTPIDFFLLIDCPGTDPTQYSVKGFVTQEQFFPTEADLRTAFESGALAQAYAQPEDTDWALVDYKPDLGLRELEDQFAPNSIELGGKRYKLDAENQYVEYMGWSFYMSFTRTLGIMFYDISFKGERILYELSLQEALAQYAGNQPKAANTVYHDTYYSLGTDMATLLEGFDCAYGSTMLNVSYHEFNTTTVQQNAICMFEADNNYPLSRHRYGGGNSTYPFTQMGVVKGSALTVRAIATVGNYGESGLICLLCDTDMIIDYMFDYIFHLDASLEVVVRASGYLQSSFYYPDQGKWGPRIQQATQGSLHDHILTYKADFDLLGRENSFEVTELVVKNVTQPWFAELGEFEQMELDAQNLHTEASMDWAGNGQAMYCIVNEDYTNSWGTKRGYRMIPGRSNVHLTVQNSPWSMHNAEYAKHHFAVTRQHDNEPYCNSVQNVNLPMKPQQDFKKFFDGESLDQEDLVVWFNLGMHHFVRSEGMRSCLLI